MIVLLSQNEASMFHSVTWSKEKEKLVECITQEEQKQSLQLMLNLDTKQLRARDSRQ